MSLPRSDVAERRTVKFVLLHDVKNDDGIRAFFVDLWEAYVKVGGRAGASDKADTLHRRYC